MIQPPRTRSAHLDEPPLKAIAYDTASLRDFRICTDRRSEIGPRVRTIAPSADELDRVIQRGAPASDLLYEKIKHD